MNAASLTPYKRRIAQRGDVATAVKLSVSKTFLPLFTSCEENSLAQNLVHQRVIFSVQNTTKNHLRANVSSNFFRELNVFAVQPPPSLKGEGKYG
jgi:hypothetical protein